MKILNIILVIIVALLSLGAGAAKIMKAPQEVVFFETLGIGPAMMMTLGVMQLTAAILILPSKSRKIGAIIATISFLISAVMIFILGQLGFGLFSLLPVALAVYIFISSKPITSIIQS